MSDVDWIDLFAMGWTDERSRHWNEHYEGTPGLEPCRIAAQRRGSSTLWTRSGVYRGELSGRFEYAVADESELPAVGDWVAAALRPDEQAATIQALLPRSSALIRKAPEGRGHSAQVLAANLDSVWIVTALNRDFNPRRIERTLALVRESGAQPVVVLSKCDLVESYQSLRERAMDAAAGVAVHAVSAHRGNGLGALREMLAPGRSVALIGSSGVGKSTLINALIGEERMETREARGDDDRGRHTTTHREMLRLPGGGLLIDTPGLREIALWADDEGGIEAAFPDLAELFAACRFSDCAHESEPGCAVQAALSEGTLDPSRLESFRKLKREAERAARLRDEKGRFEERRKQKRFTKSLRKRVDKRDRF